MDIDAFDEMYDDLDELMNPNPNAPECMFCGRPELLDLFEVYPEDRAFQIKTCCPEFHEYVSTHLDEVPTDYWRHLFSLYNISIRRILTGGEGMFCYTTSAPIDFGLKLVESRRETEADDGRITREQAKAFIKKHHRHNAPPVSWKFGFGIKNGAELVAVAMVGRPVARMLDHTKVVEVNRVCVVDNKLTEHACSKLYAAAAREAKRRGFEKIITYTLESESGTSLRAAGWEPEAETKGGSWDRATRRRTDTAPTCKKVRWAKQLRKAA